MHKTDEFSKWVKVVENGILGIAPEDSVVIGAQNSCDCGNWDCPACFPDMEEPMGDIEYPVDVVPNTDVHEPETLLGEYEVDEAEDDMDEPNPDSPLSARDFNDEMSQIDPEDAMSIIGKILYMQEIGLSNSDKKYTEDELASLPAVKLKSVEQAVLGGVTEATSKPIKTKQDLPDLDFGDILGNNQDYLPAEPSGNDDGEYNDVLPDPEMPAMRRASAADTKMRTQSMTPSDEMRGWLGRINPLAGGDEPELMEPITPENELTVRTANDVPAVIANTLQVAGEVNPEWHGVNNLPGFNQRNIRGMGRQIFGMFTSTPLEQIQTIANVNGQGPNTDAEVRSVASWLMNNAEDLGDVQLDHGEAIPGYRPDVKEYRINGVRFHVVRDPMGQYIYAYPDTDARTNTGNTRIGQERGTTMGNIPRLNESKGKLKLSLLESLDWDEMMRTAIKEAQAEYEVDEASTLSQELTNKNAVKGEKKLSAGANKLISLMHSKHKLAQDAILHSYPFSDRIYWENFKEHPDQFQIIKCRNGVCAIKPSLEDFKQKTEKAAKAHTTYNPRRDTNLRYLVVAFMNDGSKIDPQFLRNPDAKVMKDPTQGDVGDLMRTRGGDIAKPDKQYSIFDKLRAVMGQLESLWVTRGYASDPTGQPEELNTEPLDKQGHLYTGDERIHRPSVNHKQGEARRAAAKVNDPLNREPTEFDKTNYDFTNTARSAIFKKIRPIMKRMGNQALMLYKQQRREEVEYDAPTDVQEATMAKIKELNNFLIALDTTADVNAGSPAMSVFNKAVDSSFSELGRGPADRWNTEFKNYLEKVANGNFSDLVPIMKRLQNNMGIIDRPASSGNWTKPEK